MVHFHYLDEGILSVVVLTMVTVRVYLSVPIEQCLIPLCPYVVSYKIPHLLFCQKFPTSFGSHSVPSHDLLLSSLLSKYVTFMDCILWK